MTWQNFWRRSRVSLTMRLWLGLEGLTHLEMRRHRRRKHRPVGILSIVLLLSGSFVGEAEIEKSGVFRVSVTGSNRSKRRRGMGLPISGYNSPLWVWYWI